jgi:transposase
MIYKQNVGVDLSMDKFDVNLTILDSDFEKHCLGTKVFKNNKEGFDNLLTWVEKKKQLELEESFTIEFTGVYYERLAYFLREHGKTIHMVIPSKAKKYSESLSISSKTDKLDAQALAWMGLERKLKNWEPLSPIFLSLRSLTREREELLKEKTIINNRLHAANHKEKPSVKTIKRYHTRLDLINLQIDEVEHEIKSLIKSDQELHEKVKTIVTIPSVALITVATVLAETNGFSAILNQKQLTSYAGYDVKLKESGKYKGKSKISKQGNAHIRRVLHLPAINATTYNKPLSNFHQRVNEKKEKPMIAYVAVQRKLLCLIYTIWKGDRVFDPNYETNKYYYKEVG